MNIEQLNNKQQNNKQQNNGQQNIEQQIQEQIDTTASQTVQNRIDFANTPIVDVVNNIIYDSAKAGASDIHFDHLDKCLRVRIRIDGLLNDYADIPNDVKNNVITRIKIISGMNITESRLPQDGAIKTTLSDLNLDMRVSSLPTKKGEKIVIRILDYTRSLKGIEYLFFSEENYKKILRMIGEPNGIILVTGATGSGKSTTVYSFLQRLNVKGTNLITVEDPVEMDIEGINQVQVNSDIGLDFANVLRSILRQDPNVIMIGEIRDSETARIAVRASITGHLVLSTLHTNNSLTTIERLLDMDVERYLLATALSGIISQKLARQLCDKCKKLRDTTKYEQEMFHKFLNMDVKQIYDANGCPECNGGYHGRVAIQEVLLINPDIRDAINARMQKSELRKLVYNKNAITLLQDGLYKVLGGFTTIEEIIKLTEADDEVNAETQVKSQIEAKNDSKDEDIEEENDNIENVAGTENEEKVEIKNSPTPEETPEINLTPIPEEKTDTNLDPKNEENPNINIIMKPEEKADINSNQNTDSTLEKIPTIPNINNNQDTDLNSNINIGTDSGKIPKIPNIPSENPDTNSNINIGTDSGKIPTIPNIPSENPDTNSNINISTNTEKIPTVPNINANPNLDTKSTINIGTNTGKIPTIPNINPGPSPNSNVNNSQNIGTNFGKIPTVPNTPNVNPIPNIGTNPNMNSNPNNGTNSNTYFGLNLGANSNMNPAQNISIKPSPNLGPNVGVNIGTNMGPKPTPTFIQNPNDNHSINNIITGN